jgi:hypothetical protein
LCGGVLNSYEKRWTVLGRLIIDGNSVYEVDEECLKKRKVPSGCGVAEAIRRQEQQKDGEKKAKEPV